MAQETSDIAKELEARLPAIDEELARIDVPINQRPTQAAINFVTRFIAAVRENDEKAKEPGEVGDFVASRWFAHFFAQVHAWYVDKYPQLMTTDDERHLLGVVSISGTLFALCIPIVRSRPGRPGRTVWISFPNGVRSDERPIDWIKTPPNLDRMTQKERLKVEKDATEVANNLREIHAGLMGLAPSDDDKLTGLINGTRSNLRRAAQMLLDIRSNTVQQTYWEIHFACEQALKAVQQQRERTFRETHDLFLLYDDIKPAPGLKRDLLKKIPRWEEVVDLRYGQGERARRDECLKCYGAALQIVAGAVRSMKKLSLGDASFEIQRPPWMREVDDELQSRND